MQRTPAFKDLSYELHILFQCKIDGDTGDPLDILDTETQKWVESLGSKATTLSEISKTKDPVVSIRYLIYLETIKFYTLLAAPATFTYLFIIITINI